MLGLPSTTEVGRRLPKEAFYAHLKMTEALRRSFIDDVDHIEVAHSIKPSVTGIPDGETVHEVLVVEAALKARRVPVDVLAAIASVNANKIVFACTFGNEVRLSVLVGSVAVGEWQEASETRLELCTENMDKVWDSLASQVVCGDMGVDNLTVEERSARDAKLKQMREELARLEVRMRKEHQFAKKNDLYEKAERLKTAISMFSR